LTNTNVSALAINSSGDIFAGTASGVFRSVEPTTAVEEISSSSRLHLRLSRIILIPLIQPPLIQYQLQVVSDVELTIYNRLGQEVRTLVKELQPSGAYQVEWNGQDNRGKPVVSGVYLYRLTAGRYVETRKLTLLK